MLDRRRIINLESYKKQSASLLVTLFVIAAMVQSCEYHNEEELYPNQDCETENISFSGQILPLIQTQCAISGCHVTGTGRVVLTGYQGVKGVVDDGRLMQQAVISRSMPPDRPLTNCQIEQLKAWVDQGALNN
jgi:hypothetical protein